MKKSHLLLLGLLLFCTASKSSAAPTLIEGNQIDHIWKMTNNIGLKILKNSAGGPGTAFSVATAGSRIFEISSSGAIGLRGSFGTLGQCLQSAGGSGSTNTWGTCGSGSSGGGRISGTGSAVSPVLQLALFNNPTNLSGSDAFATRGRNLGIRTNNPKAALTVNGSGAFTGSLSGATLRIMSGATILNGNVSIGTLSSTAKLNVVGTISGSKLQINNAALGGGSITDNFMNLTATMPTTMTANTFGAVLNITGAGSSSRVSQAFRVDYLAGYTGSSSNQAGVFVNRQAGTGNDFLTFSAANAATGNGGLNAVSIGTTTGLNYGGYYGASGGDTSVGLIAGSTVAKSSATNIGLISMALNTSGTHNAGYFGLDNKAPSFTNAALVADNGTGSGSPIFLGRVQGATVDTFDQSGALIIGGVKASAKAALQIRGTISGSALTVNGNVGFGKSPTVPFDVRISQASHNTPQIIFTQAGAGNGSLFMLNGVTGGGNPGFSWGVDGTPKASVNWSVSTNTIGFVNLAYSSAAFGLTLDSAGSLIFQDGATGQARLTMTKDGNTIITGGSSTKTPATKLEVVGTISGSALTISNPAGTNYVLGNLGIGISPGTNRLLVSGGPANIGSAGAATLAGDFGVSREVAPTSGVMYFGNGGKFQYFDGSTMNYGFDSFAFNSSSGNSTSTLKILSSSTSKPVLEVLGAANQTGDLQQWQNSGGTPQSVVFASGALSIKTSAYKAALNVLGTISGSALTISGLKSCDTIDTDAAGNFLCGTDATGGAGSTTAAQGLTTVGTSLSLSPSFSGSQLVLGASKIGKGPLTVYGSGAFTKSLSGNTLQIQSGAYVIGLMSVGAALPTAGNQFAVTGNAYVSGTLGVGNSGPGTVKLGVSADGFFGTKLMVGTSAAPVSTLDVIFGTAASASGVWVRATGKLTGVAGAGTNSPYGMSVLSQSGGATTGTTGQTAGRGGGVRFTAGAGGPASGASGTNYGGSGGLIELYGGRGGPAVSGQSGNGGSIYIVGGPIGEGTTGTAASGNVLLAIGNPNAPFRQARGNVGIGKRNPLAKLDVLGTISGSLLTINSGSAGLSYLTGNLGIGTTSPSTKLEVVGTMSGTGLSVGGSGSVVNKILTATATLDFGSLVSVGCEDQTVTVGGAALGDQVSLGVPNGSVPSATFFYTTPWVSSANVVTIRGCALVSGDPASGTFKITVFNTTP